MSQARTFGAFIRQRREALGLTQEEAAMRAGFPHRQRWGQLENDTKFSSPDVRREVARVLGVRHVDLLIGAGELLPEEVPGADGVTPPSELERRYQALTPVSRQAVLRYVGEREELDAARARESRAAQTPEAPVSTSPPHGPGS